MIGKSNAVLLALLLALPTAFMATALIAPVQGQTTLQRMAENSDSLRGRGTNVPGGISPTIPAGPTGFANRYNVTNVCVELYRFKSPRTGHDFSNPNLLRHLLGTLAWEGPAPPVS
jgi:hypothetical protein